MVLIARDIAGHTAAYLAWRMGEPVPDGLALAVLIPRALNLECGRRCAPDELFWKASSLYLRFRHCSWHLGCRQSPGISLLWREEQRRPPSGRARCLLLLRQRELPIDDGSSSLLSPC